MFGGGGCGGGEAGYNAFFKSCMNIYSNHTEIFAKHVLYLV